MAATADQCSALQKDANFQSRVMSLAMQYARNDVYVELTTVTNHIVRLNYARSVMNGGGGNIIPSLANSVNLIASNITYDFSDGHVKTDASDTAISSQLSTDWNMLSGV